MWGRTEEARNDLEAADALGFHATAKMPMLLLRAQIERFANNREALKEVQEHIVAAEKGAHDSVLSAEAHAELGSIARLEKEWDRARHH